MGLKEVVGLFDKYFLYLMIIHCLILIFIDTSTFKKENNENNEQKSKLFGYSFLVVSIMLFFIAKFSS